MTGYYYSELVITIEDNEDLTGSILNLSKSTHQSNLISANTGNSSKQLVHKETNQAFKERCLYKTCAYFSCLTQHVVPIHPVHEDIPVVENLTTRKSDTFIIWQGHFTVNKKYDQPNLETPLDVSSDKVPSIKAYENLVKPKYDKCLEISSTSGDKCHEDSAYQTSNTPDNNDHNNNNYCGIQCDEESPVDCRDTFDTTSEISSFTFIKSNTINMKSTFNENSNDITDSCINDNSISPETDLCDYELSIKSKDSEILFDIGDADSQYSHPNVSESTSSSLMNIDMNSLVESTRVHNSVNKNDKLTEDRKFLARYNFITSYLSQLEEKLKKISVEISSLETCEQISHGNEYMKEIEKILQLLVLVKKDTSDVYSIISSCSEECLSASNDDGIGNNNNNVNNTNLDNECSSISQSVLLESLVLGNTDEFCQDNIVTRLSTLRSLRTDLLKRCDMLVSRVEAKQYSSQRVDEELTSISQSLALLANRLENPDNDNGNLCGTSLSTTGRLKAQILGLQEVEAELKYAEENMHQVKCEMTIQSLQPETISQKLDSVEAELFDMKVSIQNKITCLKDFHVRVSELVKMAEAELNRLKEQESELIRYTIREEPNDLEQDMNVFHRLIIKFNLQLVGPFYNAEDNVQLGLTIRAVWDNITKELIPKRFRELVAKSYERVSKNLASTLSYVSCIQSLDFLLSSDGNLTESNCIQHSIDVISDHINNLQNEMKWLHDHLEPIIMSDDRIAITTNVDDNNDNNVVFVFSETVKELSQLTTCLTNTHENLKDLCLPAIHSYHETLSYASDYLDTIERQMEVLQVSSISMINENNQGENNNNDDGDDNYIECTLVTYEKLETLRTSKEQCLQLLESVSDNHGDIIDELLNSVEQFQQSLNELPIVQEKNCSNTTVSSYISKLLDPIDSTSQRFLHFMTDLKNIISYYDQMITNLCEIGNSLEYPQESQNTCISLSSEASDYINKFDKHIEQLSNAAHMSRWLMPTTSCLNEVDDNKHLVKISERMAVVGNFFGLYTTEGHDESDKDDSSNIISGVQVMKSVLKELDCLESKLKLSCCDLIENDVFVSRMNQITTLRNEVTERLSETLKESEQMHLNNQHLEEAVVKFDNLKDTFKQSTSTLFNEASMLSENESNSTCNMFEICAESLRSRISETNNLIGELQDLISETMFTDIENLSPSSVFNANISQPEVNSNQGSINDNNADIVMKADEGSICLPSFSIPLWYKQIKINEEVVDFLEHVKNYREQLLHGYELAERLSTWLSVMNSRVTKLKMKLQCLSIKSTDSDTDNLFSHLHDISLFRLEICSQWPIIQCIIKEGTEFKDVIIQLTQDYEWDSKVDRFRLKFLSIDHNNTYNNKMSSIIASVIRSTDYNIEKIINDFNSSFNESSFLLLYIKMLTVVYNILYVYYNQLKCFIKFNFWYISVDTRNHLIETSQIQLVLKDFSSVLNESICLMKIIKQHYTFDELKESSINYEENDSIVISKFLLNHWMKIKHLEVWCEEIKSIQAILKSISSNPLESVCNGNTEEEIERLKLESEKHYLILSASKCELSDKINQENQLHLSISAYSAWLDRSIDELIKMGGLNNLNLDISEVKWKEFQAWQSTFQSENQIRLNNLLKQLPSSIFQHIFKQDKDSFTNVEEFILKDIQMMNSISNGKSLPNERIKSCLELNMSRVLRRFIRCYRHISILNKIWKKHMKFINCYAESIHSLHILFDGIQAELSKLYRPSKLVIRCTEQLNSVKNVVEQLKSYEKLVVQLYETLPVIKSLCSASELSQTVSTIKSTKHNFICLLRRATERQKILTQALKEDTRFDVGYHSLMNWLITNLAILESYDAHTLSEEKIQLSIKELLKEFNQRQSEYWLVMRMGGNLRERCTALDPEKNILGDMLNKLHITKSKFGKLLSKCQIKMEKRLIKSQNNKSALLCLQEWLHNAEEQLGIENIRNKKNTVNQTSNYNNMIRVLNSHTKATEHLRSNGTKVIDDDGDDNNSSHSTQTSYTYFSFKEYENIVSVIGDAAFIQSMNLNHSILGEELCQREKLYSEIISNNFNLSESTGLMERLARIRQAYNLRESCIQMANDIVNEMTTNYANLMIWLLDASNKLMDNSNNNNNNTNTGFISYNKKSVRKGTRNETTKSWRSSTTLYKTQLSLYAKLHFEQQHIYQTMFRQYQTVFRRIIAKCTFKSNDGIISEISEISVHCHIKSRHQLLIQYKQIVNLWHKVDQSLKCLYSVLDQSKQSFIHDITEFEEEEKWLQNEIIQLDKLIISDDEIYQNISKNSLSLSSESVEYVSDDSTNQQLFTEKMLQELEERIRLSKEKLENIKNKEKKICVRLTAYRNIFDMIENHKNEVNDSDNRTPSVFNSEKLNLSPYETINVIDSMIDCSIDEYKKYGHHLPEEERISVVTDSKSPITMTSSVNKVFQKQSNDRVEIFEKSYYSLINRISQRIKQMEYYHYNLLEHTLLVDFNFGEWRHNYLQWITSCHYRLSDIFSTRSLHKSKIDVHLTNTSGSESPRQRMSTVSLNSQTSWSSSKKSLSNSTAASSSGGSGNSKKSEKPFENHSSASLLSPSSIESLNPHETGNNNSKQDINCKVNEWNCSQFTEAVLRGKPTFSWANPVFIKAAFHTIDKMKKGRITQQQIMEAFNSKKQNKPLPIDELIAHAIEQETSKCVCQTKFLPKKIGKDKYCFGSSPRVYLVRFLNSTTIVRVGGGWMSLNEFLDSRDPCRILHKTNHHSHHSTKINSSSTASSPSTHKAPSASRKESSLGLMEVTPIQNSYCLLSFDGNQKSEKQPLNSFESKTLNSCTENNISNDLSLSNESSTNKRKTTKITGRTTMIAPNETTKKQ
ncbi:unnamed protein product [Heterobilharzia americana]|nr:unnamed protein product [Heterobilharzia americana]